MENIFCSSRLWNSLSAHRLLPWVFSGASLGDHVLEVGAGFGAATPFLHQRAPRVTSLEFATASLPKLRLRHAGVPGLVLRGDAAALPFADRSFSSVSAILVLHHLLSREAQSSAVREAFRVLRPGGLFILFEIPDTWLYRLAHLGTTFTPFPLALAAPRLAESGFTAIASHTLPGAYRLHARRPA